MLDIEKIVEDVVSFLGCRVAVYIPRPSLSGNETAHAVKAALSRVGYGAVVRGDQACISKVSPGVAGLYLDVPGDRRVLFFGLLDHSRMIGYSVYSSHFDSEAHVPIGQHAEIMRAIKARETQQKPAEKEHVMAPKEHAALNGIYDLVNKNPWFFAPQVAGALCLQVALDKLTELVEADKSAKTEEVPTFEGHPLVVGMVFEQKGERYTVRKDDSATFFYLRRESDSYDHVFGYSSFVGGMFKGQEDSFKLVSVPVEKGKFYEQGDRFLESEYGVKYILVSLDGVRALVSLEDGCNYDEPTVTASGIFGGDEENFSLLVNQG